MADEPDKYQEAIDAEIARYRPPRRITGRMSTDVPLAGHTPQPRITVKPYNAGGK